MRCQPGRRSLSFPLSIVLDRGITAKLSPALRAARVEAICPSEAYVRALNLCGGVNPSNPPARRRAPPRRAARQRFARRIWKCRVRRLQSRPNFKRIKAFPS